MDLFKYFFLFFLDMPDFYEIKGGFKLSKKDREAARGEYSEEGLLRLGFEKAASGQYFRPPTDDLGHAGISLVFVKKNNNVYGISDELKVLIDEMGGIDIDNKKRVEDLTIKIPRII